MKTNIIDILKNFYSENKIFVWSMLIACSFIFFNITTVDMVGDDAIYSARSIGNIDFMFDAGEQSTPLFWFNKYPWWAYFSNHDHPPLLFFIQHLFLIFSTSILAAKLPYALMGLGTLLLLYLWTKQVFNKTTAILTTFILIFNSHFIWSARTTYLDGGVIFFVVLTLYTLNKFLNQKKYWWLFGISFGLTLLTKYTAFFIISTILIYLFTEHKSIFKNKQIYLALLTTIIIFTPVIIFNIGMYQTTGHFDLQFSGLVGQNNPWHLSRTIENNYWQNFINIFKIIGEASSWPYLILALISFSYYTLKSQKTLPIYSFIFLIIMFIILKPGIRFISIFNVFLAIFIGYTLNSFYQFITNKFYINKKILISIIILLIGYPTFFIFNNHILVKPFGKTLGLTLSTTASKNYGVAQLDKYLNQLLKNKFLINQIDPAKKLKLTQPRLAKYLLNTSNPLTVDTSQKKMADVFVFDNNINWFSKVWLFERRIFYNNIYFFNDKEFAKLNKNTEQVGLFYFIKATEYAPLDKTKYRTDISKVIEKTFIAHNIKPIKLIRRNDGQVAFKIYHYQSGDFN